MAAVWTSQVLADFMTVVLIVAAVLAALRTLLVLVTTGIHVQRSKFRGLLQTAKPVTVIIPACNEKEGAAARPAGSAAVASHLCCSSR